MTDPISGIVAVDGATGYVGSHLIHKLCQQGTTVRAIVHAGARAEDCQFLESCGATIFRTDLQADSAILAQALAGATSMVHLIGSIAPPKGQKLEDLHAGQSKQLVEACKKSGSKVIMITALGTSAEADSVYHRTKWQAEELLRQSGLAHVILRPSLIVGRLVGRRDSKLMARYIQLIEEKPRVPLVGGGKNLVQPVFVADLAAAIVKSIANRELTNKTLEIGGSEVLSMKDLVLKLMEILQISKPLLAIPPALASIAASLLELVQTVPLLSCEQVKLSLKDNICSQNALGTILNLEPEPLARALSTYKKTGSRTSS